MHQMVKVTEDLCFEKKKKLTLLNHFSLPLPGCILGGGGGATSEIL